MLLYNIGDSHTSDKHNLGRWCPEPEDHYWYKISKFLGIDRHINDSEPGIGNQQMIRKVSDHCLKYPHEKTLYIINTTTALRLDIFEQKYPLENVLRPPIINKINFELIEANLYSNLIGLIELLKSKNKNFFIINNVKNYSSNTNPMLDSFIAYFKKEPRILNWFDNSRVDFHQTVTGIKPIDYASYGWMGHDGKEGHLAYSEMLIKRITNL